MCRSFATGADVGYHPTRFASTHWFWAAHWVHLYCTLCEALLRFLLSELIVGRAGSLPQPAHWRWWLVGKPEWLSASSSPCRGSRAHGGWVSALGSALDCNAMPLSSGPPLKIDSSFWISHFVLFNTRRSWSCTECVLLCSVHTDALGS